MPRSRRRTRTTGRRSPSDVLAVVDYDLGAFDWAAHLVGDPLLSTLDVAQRGDAIVFRDGLAYTMFGPIGFTQQVDLLFERVPAP